MVGRCLGRDGSVPHPAEDDMTAQRPSPAPVAASPRAARSPWSPLHNAVFRSLWIATIVSNVGGWMQDVGAGWLMTSLSPSPSMVALVEAADSFPLMLLALPAGALADIVDRRRLLIVIQIYLLVVAGALGALTWLEITSAWLLLGQQHRHQRLARDRTGDCRIAGGGGRRMARFRAQCPVLHRRPCGAAALAARAPQEHATRGTLLQRHSRGHALCHAFARATDRADPWRRILRLRQRNVVPVSPHRAARTRAGSGNLRPFAYLHRGRFGRRGHAPAAGAGEHVARHAGGSGERALRPRHARPRAPALRGPARGSHGRHRQRLDCDSLGAADFRPNDPAGVGPRQGTGRICRRIHGWHGA